MDVKALLNERPLMTIGICVIVVGAALWWGMRRGAPPKEAIGTGQIYFSADDGASWKPFSQFSIPPFEDGGKTWVRAHVFKCPGESARVGYLEQYPPAVKERLMSLQGNGGVLSEAMDHFSTRGTLVKKPGSKDWLPRNADDPASTAITNVMCGNDRAKEVLP